MSPPRPAKAVPYSIRLSDEPWRVGSSYMLKKSSMSTGRGVSRGTVSVPSAGIGLCVALPRVISTYLSPSDDFGRTLTTLSTGSWLEVSSSASSSRAPVEPSSRAIAPILRTMPTRAPPIRTSLPAIRPAASGSTTSTL